MRNIQDPAITSAADFDAADIPIGHRPDGQVGYRIGAEIEACMKMVWPQLCVIARHDRASVEGEGKSQTVRLCKRMKGCAKKNEKQQSGFMHYGSINSV